jgi:hypothetical protein
MSAVHDCSRPPRPVHGRRLGPEEHRPAVAQPQSVAVELLVGDLVLAINASAMSPDRVCWPALLLPAAPGSKRKSRQGQQGSSKRLVVRACRSGCLGLRLDAIVQLARGPAADLAAT